MKIDLRTIPENNNLTTKKAEDQPSLLDLFWTFFRLGITAFGGPSMVAYIRRLAVEKKHWLGVEVFNDGVAMCQMVPGATAMQATAYVGLKKRGVPGAAACFIGFGLPAFLLMMSFAAVFSLTHNLPVVVSAFKGLQAIIVAIVANATLTFSRATLKTWRQFLIAAFSASLFGLNANPLLVITLAILAGVVLLKPKQVSTRAPAGKLDFSIFKPILVILSTAFAGLLLLYFLDRELFKLAILFFRIDLTAFGGGFASIPLMLHEIVDVRHWLDASTFMNGIVLGQVTPGPIVITATFIGYLLHGPVGGLVATISIFLPSFLMVTGITPIFDRLRASSWFNKAISGVLCSFVGLLFTVIFRFGCNVSWDLRALLLAGAALAALLLKVDVFWVVLTGLALSIILYI
jgi:chromate transporter